MATHSELRIQPPPEALAAVRAWLDPVRRALGEDFLSAYLTGSVLLQGFDFRKSHINALIISRSLEEVTVDRLREALPHPKGSPHVDPLFLTRRQIENSLDSFPIEWLDIQERRLLLEGEDVFAAIEVPNTYLRLQLEHELRAKHIRLRQAYIVSSARPAGLQEVMASSASSFATLFRTLLRLHGESPPASTAQTIERTADVFKLDAEGLLGAHLVRHGSRRYKADEIVPIYRKFLAQISRLVIAIDQLRVP
jgi:hypothetical protein